MIRREEGYRCENNAEQTSWIISQKNNRRKKRIDLKKKTKFFFSKTANKFFNFAWNENENDQNALLSFILSTFSLHMERWMNLFWELLDYTVNDDYIFFHLFRSVSFHSIPFFSLSLASAFVVVVVVGSAICLFLRRIFCHSLLSCFVVSCWRIKHDMQTILTNRNGFHMIEKNIIILKMTNIKRWDEEHERRNAIKCNK